jgi:hypothetical protein
MAPSILICARHTYMAHVTLTPCSYSHTPNYLHLHTYTFLMKYPLKLFESRIPAMAPSILVSGTPFKPNLQRLPYAPSPTCPHTLLRSGQHRWSITSNVTPMPPSAIITHTPPTLRIHRSSLTSNVTPTPQSPTCRLPTYIAHVRLPPV